MPRILRVSPPVSPPLRVRLQMHCLERGLSQLQGLPTRTRRLPAPPLTGRAHLPMVTTAILCRSRGAVPVSVTRPTFMCHKLPL